MIRIRGLFIIRDLTKDVELLKQFLEKYSLKIKCNYVKQNTISLKKKAKQ